MTALALPVESLRDSRIYRVNAWRAYKGRPALDFDAPKPVLRLEPESEPGPRPPEWWTAENTARWQAEVWGGEVEVSDAQRSWGGKITVACGRASASTYTPISPKQWKEWAKSETRPPCPTFYDGTPQPRR